MEILSHIIRDLCFIRTHAVLLESSLDKPPLSPLNCYTWSGITESAEATRLSQSP